VVGLKDAQGLGFRGKQLNFMTSNHAVRMPSSLLFSIFIQIFLKIEVIYFGFKSLVVCCVGQLIQNNVFVMP
jgi:hypothetical protein